jgi:hypothetical protein
MVLVMDEATSLPKTFLFETSKNLESENPPISTASQHMLEGVCLIKLLLCLMKIIFNVKLNVYQDKRNVTEILNANKIIRDGWDVLKRKM